MNPFANNGSQPSPFDSLMTTLQNGADPQVLAQNILNNNPNLGQELQYMKQQCGNNNPKDYVLSICQQRGVNPTVVNGLARLLGLH